MTPGGALGGGDPGGTRYLYRERNLFYVLTRRTNRCKIRRRKGLVI